MHSPGYIRVDRFGVITGGIDYCTSIAECCQALDAADHSSCVSPEQLAEGNCRRLVACWNAVEGISTPLLESGIVEDYILAYTEAAAYVMARTTTAEELDSLVEILLAIRAKIRTIDGEDTNVKPRKEHDLRVLLKCALADLEGCKERLNIQDSDFDPINKTIAELRTAIGKGAQQ